MLCNNRIKEYANIEGFDLVGVTFPREFELNRAAIERWIEQGNADSLSYMKRYMDVRFNPANLLEGSRSVVVCAINYKSDFSMGQCDPATPKIASYALAADYHKVIRKQLKALLRRLQLLDPSIEGRCCVDTAPLLEKQLAVEAGLGWIGRQSLLITPQFGSFVVLGVLLLNVEVDIYDEPLSTVGCGECRRCIDICPNGAILEERMIDSRLCISALTVECDNPDGRELHGWLFGCDMCQSCCPYNRNTPLGTNVAMQPIVSPIAHSEWRAMGEEEFSCKFAKTPLKRAGLERLKRVK
ncbi:MAG: tRNA epoxyqueuosine(34) reductase QueG [Rikenellaceae bacterium]